MFSLKFASMTTLFLLIGTPFILADSDKKESKVIDLKTEGQPTLGDPKAFVHLVVFEEPKCSDCRDFTMKVFPKLKKEFIDTHKIRYTLIPVSFISHSMVAANAWMCVFHQDKNNPNPELFFKYVDTTYAHQAEEDEDWTTPDNLEKFAKETSADIRLEDLKQCIKQETFYKQIEENTDYAMDIMHGELGTPTLYINGALVEDMRYEKIRTLIQEALKNKGAK